jgi:molybdate transport system substrate-binding protein
VNHLRSTLLSLALVLCAASAALAQQDITVIAPGGAVPPVKALIPGFEAKTGYKVTLTPGSGLGTKKQITAGDPFDVSVLQPPFPEVLASGNVVVKSQKALASVAVGVAVRKGAPKPDISTPAAVKKLLLSVKSFAYPDSAGGAAAGVSFDKTLRQLGIMDQVKAKIIHAKGGAGAMDATARGEVEIGLTYLSEMDNPGIDIVGPLPAEISPPTRLVAFVGAKAKNPKAAQALVDYLSSPAAAGAYRAVGLTPHE